MTGPFYVMQLYITPEDIVTMFPALSMSMCRVLHVDLLNISGCSNSFDYVCRSTLNTMYRQPEAMGFTDSQRIIRLFAKRRNISLAERLYPKLPTYQQSHWG